MSQENPSRSRDEARESLPEELRPAFDELADYYRYATSKHYGRSYVAYLVVAELILAGWRASASPLPELSKSGPRKQ